MAADPKRNRIEVTCPDCGHRQMEPAMAVSSVCRACQINFKIVDGQAVTKEKKVQPFARVRKEPVEEEVVETKKESKPPIRVRKESVEDEPTEEKKSPEPPVRVRKESTEPDEPEKKTDHGPPVRTRKEEVVETDGGSIKQQSYATPFTRTRKEEEVKEDELNQPRVESYSPGDRQSTEPSDARPFWLKMVKPGKPPRQIKCFECDAAFTVLGDAQSSQCPKCGSYISLEDYEISEVYNRRIQTRGDVKIHKKGSITGSTIKCHHLTVLGELAGSVECSGDLIIRSHGKIIGTVVCRNLRIEKGAKVEFLNPVKAETARIDGEVHGQISCTGSVTLEKRAKLHGLVRTTSLVVKPGAKHSGMIEMVSKDEKE